VCAPEIIKNNSELFNSKWFEFWGDLGMIMLNNLEGYKKGRIWINNPPNIRSNSVDKVVKSIETKKNLTWKEKYIAIELLLSPRQASSYAFIGAKYTPSTNDKLEIIVNISGFNDSVMVDNIALSTDEVHVGIPKDYALTIINAAIEKTNELNFPSGHLYFNIGAHGHVGSSKTSFRTATIVIMELFYKNIVELTSNIVSELVEDIFKNKIS
jgi:hypothetical protein